MYTGKPITAEEVNAIPMNFVVGKERSGTTLLQVMLNAHPNIAAPPESRFIVLLYHKYGAIKNWSEKNINNFCNNLFEEGLIRNHWMIDRKKLYNQLLSVKDSLTYALVCKIVFLQWDKSGKQITLLFDKNPVYYYFLPILKNIFPEACYVHLVRDYRANIASHQRVFKIKRASDLAYRWIKINELVEAAKLCTPGKYFTLKYESLVSDPENCMKEVCVFLQIPFSDKMVEDHTASLYTSFKENKKERFKEVHGSLFQPINSTHINEWTGKLSPEEVRESEAIAGKYGLAKYGYLMSLNSPAKLNFLRLLFIKTKYVLNKTTYRIVFSNLTLYYFIKRKVWGDF
jgi:hypothetical protein